MRNGLFLVLTAVGLIAVVLTVSAYFRNAGGMNPGAGGPAMLAGAPAQSFPLESLAGGNGALEDYRGKVVLVNLWATWCAPCRSETPALEQLYRTNQGRGLVVLGIDQGESRAAATKFAHELSLTYPILIDTEQRYGRAYAAIGLPTSVLVDRTGRIVQGVDGERTLAEFQALVNPVLKAQ
jgi:cytochrome c biogenesis protein CcmG, thiol:disulfide interchange protein DsbE